MTNVFNSYLYRYPRDPRATGHRFWEAVFVPGPPPMDALTEERVRGWLQLGGQVPGEVFDRG
jgi:hypothetical protein